MRIVEFFETAPIDAAASVLEVCRFTVAKRQPATSTRKPRTPKRQTEQQADA